MKPNVLPVFKQQLTLFLAAVLTWVGIVCAIPQSAHACCKGTGNSIHRKMPCCIVQPAVITTDQASKGLTHPNLDVGGLPNLFKFDISVLQVPNEQPSLACEWHPDQSKRYLELRVLLN